MRRFVIGDIHGNVKALIQCLNGVNFDNDKDQLVCLGDVCDGYPDTPQCINMLMNIKNLVWIEGNHDTWCRNWMQDYMDMRERFSDSWLMNGGESTRVAYLNNYEAAQVQRKFWIEKPVLYHRIDDIGFVHAGINPDLKFAEHVGYSKNILTWDLSLWARALQRPDDIITYAEGIKLLFIGHSAYKGPLIMLPSLINLDTGAGWGGRLTIMNIDTKEYFQSSLGTDLYPGYQHRGIKGKRHG